MMNGYSTDIIGDIFGMYEMQRVKTILSLLNTIDCKEDIVKDLFFSSFIFKDIDW